MPTIYFLLFDELTKQLSRLVHYLSFSLQFKSMTEIDHFPNLINLNQVAGVQIQMPNTFLLQLNYCFAHEIYRFDYVFEIE